jgi:hypothetical protein
MSKYTGEICHLFGEKNKFAVEAKLIQNNLYCFISYCYWIKNKMTGDINQLSLLQSQIEEIKNVIKNVQCDEGIKNNRLNETLNITDDVEITPVGECFDGFQVIFTRANGYDLIIGRNLILNNEIQIKLPKNEYLRVMKDFYDWIRESTIITLKIYLTDIINKN